MSDTGKILLERSAKTYENTESIKELLTLSPDQDEKPEDPIEGLMREMLQIMRTQAAEIQETKNELKKLRREVEIKNQRHRRAARAETPEA